MSYFDVRLTVKATNDIPPIAEQLKIDPTNPAHPTTVPFWNYKRDQNISDLGEASMNLIEGEDMKILEGDEKFQLTLATKSQNEVMTLLGNSKIVYLNTELESESVLVNFPSEEDFDNAKRLFNDKYAITGEIRQKKLMTVAKRKKTLLILTLQTIRKATLLCTSHPKLMKTPVTREKLFKRVLQKAFSETALTEMYEIIPIITL